MSYIEFKNIHKYFGDNHVLKGIEMNVEEGAFVTLLGPSGCGKSTLLRCMAGLETVSSGNIYLDGTDITAMPPQKRSVGMVFQQYSLFPNLNVYDNISFGLKLQKLPTAEIRKRVERLIECVELEGKESAYPSSLSGGQQQRVALARSMVLQPKVLLMDEPLSAIDAKLRKNLRSHIMGLHKEFGITCLFVTHDQDEALIMSDTIHLFHNGIIEQSGNPISMYTRPQTQFAASFIGNYNVLAPNEFARLTGEDRSNKDIAIRPEAIEIFTKAPENKDELYILPAVVKDYIPHGNVLRYSVMAKDVLLHTDVLFRSFHLYNEGEQVFLSIEKRNCLELN